MTPWRGGRGRESGEQGRPTASGDVSPLIPFPQMRAAAALTTSPDTLTKSTTPSLEVFKSKIKSDAKVP